MSENSNLHNAKRAKNDEFYTQLTDIEKELYYYKDHFKGKVVLCNCNDALHSNFAKYFSLQFEFLGLKKLICTAYKVDGIHGKVAIYNGDKNGNGVPDIEEWEHYMLEGDGSFDSDECVEFLKEADVVVTNPPFSLFRSYVKLLMEYGKKFLIIGNMNAITYKEIFPYIKDNELWSGLTFPNRFVQTDGTIKSFGNIKWFTNLSHNKRNTPLDLYRRYKGHESEFPKYDNYDAINVDRVSDIPMDYDGVMGVPITFLDSYCPEQFEIIWTTDRGGDGFLEKYKIKHDRYDAPVLKGKGIYKRILIKKKTNNLKQNIYK